MSDRVADKFATFVAQPEPLIAVTVRPAGSASVTVTDPNEAAVPTFVTTTVYVSPTSPCVKLPVCDLRTARSAKAVAAVTVKLLEEVAVPPNVATATDPEVAPAGTVAVICVVESMLNAALMP